MEPFEFVMILVSIIIALGVAELLAGVARILRGDLQAYWIHAVWIADLLVLQLQYCWTLFDLESRAEWVFIDLIRLLIPGTAFFLASTLLFPRRGERADLETYYYANRQPVLMILAAIMLYYTFLNLSFGLATLVQILGICALIGLIRSSDRRIHAALTLLFFAGTLFVVFSFSYRLGASAF